MKNRIIYHKKRKNCSYFNLLKSSDYQLLLLRIIINYFLKALSELYFVKLQVVMNNIEKKIAAFQKTFLSYREPIWKVLYL